MSLSVLDIFKIGLGPSSSHTMGPMNAARQFVVWLETQNFYPQITRLKIELFGSLALTGLGHCTDRAILLGLEGLAPDTLDPEMIQPNLDRIRKEHSLRLNGKKDLNFIEDRDLLWNKKITLPQHPNGMRFHALTDDGVSLASQEFYSVGGGFVVRAEELTGNLSGKVTLDLPFPFHSAASLLELCQDKNIQIYELMLLNEKVFRPEAETLHALNKIYLTMQKCVDQGFKTEGILPGSLKVKRRAPKLFQTLSTAAPNPLQALDWVSAYALAVNEENAAGGRVVTAPTNGAAGIVPAVLFYYRRFENGSSDEGVMRFLLTAGAIGMLYKRNASISGAEMGCQGEVGVACSMAAAGLVAALSGSNQQIENAAEIGMEHNLGLTCDPVGGLVQIPCIERNTMGAVKAINAARLAMHGDGTHKVSLDQVINTMRNTGRDMSSIYKETSQGGLAVNVPEC